MAAADLTISTLTLAASIFNFLNEIGNRGEKEGKGACDWAMSAMLATTNRILSQEIVLFISLDVIKSNLGRVFSIVPPSMVKACGIVK
ncbi:unnamed protein product [Linum trigynum]|uniref:Uncharacterized protein n=1 Tax=Linum trigynum TaxID=586398 RepID=A0AAV2CH55_9ROSI